MAASQGRSVLVALVQMAVGSSKPANLKRAADLVAVAARAGARLVALPECFTCPYGNKYFPEYAEPIPGESSAFLSQLAEEHGVWLVGGSMPERDATGKLYNTSTVWGPKGELLGKHRKVHLFDINIPGGIVNKESDALTPGEAYTTFEAAGLRVGLGICYDIRFPEMAMAYASMGCQLLLYPAAFNMTTGPAHWELLQRGRAVDNQLYVATVSPARDTAADYIAYGHSMCVDPWGCVVGEGGEEEDIVYAEIDTAEIDSIRQNIPVSKQKRRDMYQLTFQK